MFPLVTNATVAVLRGVYNPATKQTSAPAPVAGLGAVPVFIEDIGTQIRSRGMAAEFDLRMQWSAAYAIRDGDRIEGYNPSGAAVPPILLVQHAQFSQGLPGTGYWTCMLKAVKPAGSST